MEKFFLWNEMILVLIGVTSILTIVSVNEDNKISYKIKSMESRIEANFRFAKGSINQNYYCLPFIKSNNINQEDFDKLQKDRADMCKWVNDVHLTLKALEIDKFDTIPALPVANDNIIESYPETLEFKEELLNINKLISERNKTVDNNQNSIDLIREFNDTIGVFLLLISLGIKISELTYKLIKLKNKNSETNG